MYVAEMRSYMQDENGTGMSFVTVGSNAGRYRW